ncbi:Xylose operon regulatory protein [Posidoniimonas corsicana]|uniref:Xylose operon regulatory protein n=1 Tax=Posidoniimonas corsicana TaxID=1938618 RepID=A0A5C5UUG3_9BACT|nr:DNA-binding transcriptional regulator [Posidoniimonas corsicana]TWT29223.1 Xylose operon regulatory protein [Posidoniimonas corsicana]
MSNSSPSTPLTIDDRSAPAAHPTRVESNQPGTASRADVPRFQQIALAFPRGAHQEHFIEGVTRYASEKGLCWSFTVAPESLALSVLDLVEWPGDGVLAAINTPVEAACAAEMSIPVVNISSTLAESPVPRAMVDNLAIGKLAAEHLLSRGFTNFAFYGLSDVEYSRQRWIGFSERLAQNDATCERHLSTPTFGFRGTVWLEQHQQISTWLQQLPTPCGVFAVSDYRARHVLDACRQYGLSTPDQIAVLGVDNEQVICEHVHPTLSSVSRNDQLEGYRAAEMLDRLLRGEELSDRDAFVPPLEVVERDSTATFAVTDERLRRALSYLHDYIADPITVDELARQSEVSRRWLEYAFRDVLGETPYQYLRRQRLLLAKHLLKEDPKQSISRIAQRAGFSSVKQMRVAFQREFGVTPGHFRQVMNQ